MLCYRKTILDLEALDPSAPTNQPISQNDEDDDFLEVPSSSSRRSARLKTTTAKSEGSLNNTRWESTSDSTITFFLCYRSWPCNLSSLSAKDANGRTESTRRRMSERRQQHTPFTSESLDTNPGKENVSGNSEMGSEWWLDSAECM